MEVVWGHGGGTQDSDMGTEGDMTEGLKVGGGHGGDMGQGHGDPGGHNREDGGRQGDAGGMWDGETGTWRDMAVGIEEVRRSGGE